MSDLVNLGLFSMLICAAGFGNAVSRRDWVVAAWAASCGALSYENWHLLNQTQSFIDRLNAILAHGAHP